MVRIATHGYSPSPRKHEFARAPGYILPDARPSLPWARPLNQRYRSHTPDVRKSGRSQSTSDSSPVDYSMQLTLPLHRSPAHWPSILKTFLYAALASAERLNGCLLPSTAAAPLDSPDPAERTLLPPSK